jgi:hypothetical protein
MVAEYFAFLREFVHKAFSFDTGVEGVEMDAWSQLTQRLGEVPALETRWLHHLVAVLGGIYKYFQHLERWQNHLDNLASNLRLTEAQRHQVLYEAVNVLSFLEDQVFDLDYLHWVASDAIAELTTLIDQTEELVLEFPAVLEGIQALECLHLASGFRIVEGFSWDFRQGFYRRLSQLLNRAYTSKNPQTIKRILAEYTEHIQTTGTSQSFFIDKDNALVGFNPQQLKRRISLFEKIEEWRQSIETLVNLRATIYTQFIQHEFTIISAILPKEENHILWLRRFFTTPDQNALTFFPLTCDNELALMAIIQSLDQLERVEEQVVNAKSILADKSLRLVLEYLNSQPLRRFLEAELERIALFEDYSSQFETRLESIRDALKEDPPANTLDD